MADETLHDTLVIDESTDDFRKIVVNENEDDEFEFNVWDGDDSERWIVEDWYEAIGELVDKHASVLNELDGNDLTVRVYCDDLASAHILEEYGAPEAEFEAWISIEEHDLDFSVTEALEEYRSVSEFRGTEQAVGQVSPREIRLQDALEEAILRRLD